MEGQGIVPDSPSSTQQFSPVQAMSSRPTNQKAQHDLSPCSPPRTHRPKPTSSTSQSIRTQNTSQATTSPINLRREQEARTCFKAQQRNQRCDGYRRLVQPIAQFYASCSPEPYEDLLQVGLLGLLRAAELFSTDHQTPFEAFAKPHIRGAILHYLRDLAQPIRLPRRLLELKDRLTRLGLEQLLNEGLSAGDQRRLQELALWSRPLSLDAAMEEGLSIADGGLTEGCSSGESLQAIPLLASLDPKLEIVVRKVVLSGWSYRRTASQLNVSPMTVQRRLKRGLSLLRDALELAPSSHRALSRPNCGHPAPFAVAGC